jgi:hypothetical protein
MTARGRQPSQPAQTASSRNCIPVNCAMLGTCPNQAALDVPVESPPESGPDRVSRRSVCEPCVAEAPLVTFRGRVSADAIPAPKHPAATAGIEPGRGCESVKPCCSLKHHTGALHPANLAASRVPHPLFSPRTVADLQHSLCGAQRPRSMLSRCMLG